MKYILLVTTVVLGLVPLRAEEMARPEPIAVASFVAAPRIDGVLDDPVWSGATVIDSFVETWPGDNAPASRRTRVLLGSDARNLYLAVEAGDDAEAIRATLARRDDVLADDHVRLLFDTFDDRRRAYVLALNPFGIAQDGLWVEGREVDYSFDFVFESKGRTNAQGYALELTLPYSSIRSASGPGHAWGLHVFRKIRHLGDTELSWRPLERGRARVLEQAGRIAGFVEGAKPQRLEIIPSVTLSEDDGDGSEASMGGTIRWALGRDLVVDAALRPDFAQVEADQPVVTANQRFPLFFAEKRPFFLEGTEVFASPLSVVNTRTIVDPEIAIKASGRRGATTAGVLMARDRADSRDLAIVRVQREFDAATELGILATVMDAATRDGAVLGFDLRANPDANTAWSVQVVGTQATRPFYDPDLDRSVVRSGSGWAYSLERKRSSRRRTFTLRAEGRSPDYVADLGFTRQVDLHRWSADARYEAEPRSAGLLRSTSLETTVLLQTDAGGHPTYGYLYPQLYLKLARQSELQLFAYLDFLEIREHEFGARRSAERPGAFFGEPNRRTVYHGLAGQFTTAPTEHLSLTLVVDRAWEVLDFDLGGGARYPRVSPAALADPDAPLDPGTGRSQDWTISLDLHPTDALRVVLEWSRSLLVRDDTERVAYDQRLLTARTSYQFSRAVFARLRASYDSLAGRALVEALVAWTPTPGTAVYLGYEEPQIRDPRRFRPGDPLSAWGALGRTSFLKVSYRFGRDL